MWRNGRPGIRIGLLHIGFRERRTWDFPKRNIAFLRGRDVNKKIVRRGRKKKRDKRRRRRAGRCTKVPRVALAPPLPPPRLHPAPERRTTPSRPKGRRSGGTSSRRGFPGLPCPPPHFHFHSTTNASRRDGGRRGGWLSRMRGKSVPGTNPTTNGPPAGRRGAVGSWDGTVRHFAAMRQKKVIIMREQG